MASGDTIAGKVRYLRVDTEGNRTILAGPYSTATLDDFNQTFVPEDYLYLNTMLTQRKSAPLQAREEMTSPGANGVVGQLMPGEQIELEFLANATVANDVDHDANTISIEILQQDTNTGRIYPDELTVQDQELSSDVTESATEYKTVFRETVPDRTRYRIVGQQAYAPVEN